MHPPNPVLLKGLASAKADGGGGRLGEWKMAEPRGLLAGQGTEWPRPPLLIENLGRDSGLRVQDPLS